MYPFFLFLLLIVIEATHLICLLWVNPTLLQLSLLHGHPTLRDGLFEIAEVVLHTLCKALSMGLIITLIKSTKDIGYYGTVHQIKQHPILNIPVIDDLNPIGDDGW